jgi:hypothetical protein
VVWPMVYIHMSKPFFFLLYLSFIHLIVYKTRVLTLQTSYNSTLTTINLIYHLVIFVSWMFVALVSWVLITIVLINILLVYVNSKYALLPILITLRLKNFLLFFLSPFLYFTDLSIFLLHSFLNKIIFKENRK